jgi:hypothetical protein
MRERRGRGRSRRSLGLTLDSARDDGIASAPAVGETYRGMDYTQIVALELWLAVAFLAGRLVFTKSRYQALGFAAFALVAAAPYWQVPVTWRLYHAAATRDAGRDPGPGLAIDSLYVAGAPAIPDLFQRCAVLGSACGAVFDLKLAATEIDDFDTAGQRSGVVRFSLADAGDPRCGELAEINARPGVHDFWTLPEGRCFAVEHLDAPRSRFELSMPRTAAGGAPPQIAVAATELRDRASGEIVAWRRDYYAHVEPVWSALPDVSFDTGFPDLSLEDLRRGRRHD